MSQKNNQDKNKINKEHSVSIKPRHDELFRAIMSEPLVYKEFFDYHLPQKVKDLIDINSIKLEKSDFLNEALKESICDILFSAKLKGSGEIGYLNLLLEAQSTSDTQMSFRMIKYMVEIWNRHFKSHKHCKKLPLIYPLIFSNAEDSSNMSLDFFDLFENKELAKAFFTEPYQIIDVYKLPDAELLERVFSGTMEYTLKYGRDEGFLEKLQAIGPNLKKITEEKNIQFVDYIANILCYNIDRIPEMKQQTFKQILDNIIPQDIGDKIMGSLAEKWYYEGESRGIQIGESRGIERGEYNKAVQTAKNMLSDGVQIPTISKYTSLSISEINKIKQEIEK